MNIKTCLIISALAALFNMGVHETSWGETGASKPSGIPDEYEFGGGHSLGMANSGTVSMGDASAIKTNPAMLAMEKTYAVGASYHWPRSQAEFYNLHVVDSMTSKFAAGFSYFGRMDDVEESQILVENSKNYSPVLKRLRLGLGKQFQKLTLGIGVEQVQAYNLTPSLNGKGKETGITFGIGAAALLTRQIRLGASAENISNERMNEYSPQTFRVGAAYLLSRNASINFDAQSRKRVEYYEGTKKDPLRFMKHGGSVESEPDSDGDNLTNEHMATISGVVLFQEYLRLLAAYGQEIGGRKRQSAAGGIGVSSGKVSLSYATHKPYLSQEYTHQAVNMSIQIAL